MKLRRGERDDVEALFEIRCSVVENHQSREELAALGITTESVAAMIESGGYLSIIAEVDDRPVGFAMAQISDGYVFALFVKPGYEGQGIGKALMKTVEAGLHSAGVAEAWLATGADPRLRAVGFYRHLGWRESGFLDDGQLIFKKLLGSDG